MFSPAHSFHVFNDIQKISKYMMLYNTIYIYYTYVLYIAYHLQKSSKPVHQPEFYPFTPGSVPGPNPGCWGKQWRHTCGWPTFLRTYCIVCCCTVSPKPHFCWKPFRKHLEKKKTHDTWMLNCVLSLKFLKVWVFFIPPFLGYLIYGCFQK